MDRDREAFEAHIRSLLPHAKFDRDDSGEYIADMVNARWLGWQAALAYVREERGGGGRKTLKRWAPRIGATRSSGR